MTKKRVKTVAKVRSAEGRSSGAYVSGASSSTKKLAAAVTKRAAAQTAR